jgi:hypothetical protein
MTIVLGPCPCHSCGKHVWYDGRKWCDADGLGHSCIHAPKLWRRLYVTAKGIKWRAA